jgi:hypothetical protein
MQVFDLVDQDRDQFGADGDPEEEIAFRSAQSAGKRRTEMGGMGMP